MDKILLVFGAVALGIGTLFFSRSARGDTVNNDNESVPGSTPANTNTQTNIPRGSSPTGLRNNNPFNLEFRNIGWRGEIGTDGRFSVFDTAINGIRAGMINIHTKMTRDGLNTVRKIINRLSPSFENPTEAFINFVSGRIGVAPDQPLQFSAVIIEMSKAIIQFENGQQPFSNDQLQEALQETGRI